MFLTRLVYIMHTCLIAIINHVTSTALLSDVAYILSEATSKSMYRQVHARTEYIARKLTYKVFRLCATLTCSFLNMSLTLEEEFKKVSDFAKKLGDHRRTKEEADEETWLLRSGDLILTGDHTKVVTMVHPGYFAYLPAAQRHLYPVYLLQQELYHLARTTTDVNAPFLRRPGLEPLLRAAKEKAFAFISSVTSLRNRREGWDQEEQAARVAARSAVAQKGRSTAISRQIALIGSPHRQVRPYNRQITLWPIFIRNQQC